jgi:5-enolpyruvylshikimate-3-phosphate synthase
MNSFTKELRELSEKNRSGRKVLRSLISERLSELENALRSKGAEAQIEYLLSVGVSPEWISTRLKVGASQAASS